MTPGPQGSEPWMPNGFPPPSFVVEIERTRTIGARGRWLAAAAILGAILLIAGIVLIARDDDKADLASGSTTTSFGGTNPTFSSTTALDPTATLPDANTVPGAPVDPNATVAPGGAGATTPPAPGPGAGPAPPPAPGAGVIAAEPATLTVPTIDAIDPARAKQGGKLTLRNTGASTLSFTTQSNYSGLTASPSTGSIPAGGSVAVDVVLDGTNAPERNPFSAQLRFSGGGTTTVTVNAMVRRPPNLANGGDEQSACRARGVQDGCSSQVARTGTSSACNGVWRVRVVATDDPSGVGSVTARLSTSTTPLTLVKEADGVNWSSPDQQPLPKGTLLKFTATATDTLGAVTTGAEQTVSCP